MLGHAEDLLIEAEVVYAKAAIFASFEYTTTTSTTNKSSVCTRTVFPNNVTTSVSVCSFMHLFILQATESSEVPLNRKFSKVLHNVFCF